MHLEDKPHHQEVDTAETLEIHRSKMARTREVIARKYREAQMGFIAINKRKMRGERPSLPLKEARELFSHGAERYLHEEENLDPDTRLHTLTLAVIPRMIEGHFTLQHHNASRGDRHDAKLDLIEFNDALREIIDTNPDMHEDVIKGVFTSAMLSYGYGANEINAGEAEVKHTLIGMKHELAFEAVLSWLPEGYEILTTSDEDDKHGADFKVRCPNGVILYIDIKASPENAAEATQDNIEFYARFREQVPANQLVLYSGFKREDFGGWHPSNESIQRVLPELQQLLHQASLDTVYQQKQAQLGRVRVGHH